MSNIKKKTFIVKNFVIVILFKAVITINIKYKLKTMSIFCHRINSLEIINFKIHLFSLV